jgi:glycosyltransferase involved in cell wall biosynthesis
LRQFDVIVLPSVTISNWKEQFGRIIIEAMACGVPVIGSTCGSIPEVIGDGGIIFQEGDVTELRACLEKVADNPTFLRGLSLQARKRVLDHYAWERVAEKIHAIYQTMVRANVTPIRTTVSRQ